MLQAEFIAFADPVMKYLAHTVLVTALTMVLAVQAADAQRQEDVARRGAEVMPFDLSTTTHVFTEAADGGVQRVVVKMPSTTRQIRLVRAHLHEIQAQFLKGDFSGPAHVHGENMPGLAELQSAKPGQIAIAYKDVGGGAELIYKAADPQLVKALHAWFQAQLSDHGADAMAGHAHQPMDAPRN